MAKKIKFYQDKYNAITNTITEFAADLHTHRMKKQAKDQLTAFHLTASMALLEYYIKHYTNHKIDAEFILSCLQGMRTVGLAKVYIEIQKQFILANRKLLKLTQDDILHIKDKIDNTDFPPHVLQEITNPSQIAQKNMLSYLLSTYIEKNYLNPRGSDFANVCLVIIDHLQLKNISKTAMEKTIDCARLSQDEKINIFIKYWPYDEKYITTYLEYIKDSLLNYHKEKAIIFQKGKQTAGTARANKLAQALKEVETESELTSNSFKTKFIKLHNLVNEITSGKNYSYFRIHQAGGLDSILKRNLIKMKPAGSQKIINREKVEAFLNTIRKALIEYSSTNKLSFLKNSGRSRAKSLRNACDELQNEIRNGNIEKNDTLREKFLMLQNLVDYIRSGADYSRLRIFNRTSLDSILNRRLSSINWQPSLQTEQTEDDANELTNLSKN